MKDAYGFKHSSRTRKDIRIQAMMYEYGMRGYGLFWIIIETLATCNRNKMKFSDLTGRINTDDVFRFINDCIYEFDLFTVDEENFISTDFVKFKRKIFTNRLFNSNVDLWYEIRNQVFERDNYTCKYCGSVGGKLEADHIFPISKGGLDTIDNLTTACRRCNRQKRDKTVEQFTEWRVNHG